MSLFVCFSGVVDVLCLLLVAALWGATNPFLKKGTEGIEHVQKGDKISQFLAEAKYLFLNIKVVDFSIALSFSHTHVYNRSTLHRDDTLCSSNVTTLFSVQYLVPFLLNQSGSVVFYLTLATTGHFVTLTICL